MVNDKDFRNYYQALDADARARYAKRAGTTRGYIEAHLVHARKVPRPKLLRQLAKASNGALTVPSLVEFFYQQQ